MTKENLINEINKKNDFLKNSLNFESLKQNQAEQFILKICDIWLTKYREYFVEKWTYSPKLYLKYLWDIKNYIYKNIFLNNNLQIEDILWLHKEIMEPIKDIENIEKIWTLREKPIITKEKNYLKWLSEAFISHYKVPKKTNEAFEEYKKNISNDNKIDTITKLYINFLAKIHIFENWNGRLIFILLDTLLFKYDYLPIFIRYHEDKRDNISEKYIKHRNLNKLQLDLYEIIIEIYSNYQIK